MKKALWITCFIFCIGSCCLFLLFRKNHVRITRAENVLTTLLNTPDSQIKQMYEISFEQSADNMVPETTKKQILTELTEDNARHILVQTFGDDVTDRFITDCLTMNSIMTLQYTALIKGFTTKIESLNITETGQSSQASYEAALKLSGSQIHDQEIHVFGQVQFDDDGKINAITIQGRDLDRLYQLE